MNLSVLEMDLLNKTITDLSPVAGYKFIWKLKIPSLIIADCV